MNNSNAGDIKGEMANVSSDAEMAALDVFGPKTRAAFLYAPISVLASAILNDIRTAQRDGKFPINIRDPDVDDWISKRVLAGCYQLMCRDREQHDAALGLRPLVPRKLKRMR